LAVCSRSRHDNSTFDEQADFETSLSKIKLPDGRVSKAFPRTLKDLFSYDEHQLLQLFDDYGLRKLNTHLENLNRFLAFIGLRFSIPEQPTDFLGEPPAYPSPDVLESPKEEKPLDVLPVSPPDQAEKKTKVTPEVKSEHEKPPQEFTATNDNLVQVREQRRPDEKRMEERRDAQQDQGGQTPLEIELSPIWRPPPAVATSQRPQQTPPPHMMRSVNRNPPSPRPTQPPNPQENKARVVPGWLKSFTDGF